MSLDLSYILDLVSKETHLTVLLVSVSGMCFTGMTDNGALKLHCRF